MGGKQLLTPAFLGKAASGENGYNHLRDSDVPNIPTQPYKGYPMMRLRLILSRTDSEWKFGSWLLLVTGVLICMGEKVRLEAADDTKPKGLRAGAYAMDITPTRFPISVNGGMQDVKATVVHDRLHARCLVLDDGTTQQALVICDSCAIGRELLDDAKRQAKEATGIPMDRILIAATHTHEAPAVVGAFQSDPDVHYQKFLATKIAEGIAKAVANLEPAQLGWGVAREPAQVFNRRWKMKPGSVPANPFGKRTDQVQMNPGHQNPGLAVPAGPTDPDVSVLSVQTRAGKPLALLANYSLHYVGDVQPLSADYFGAFAERIGQMLEAKPGPRPFVGIMSNGTSGDVNNIDYAHPAPKPLPPFEKIRLVADSVARAAFSAYQSIKHTDRVTLAMVEREIELGVRLPREAEVAAARRLMEGKEGQVLKTMPEVYARETLLLAKYPATVKIKLQAIRIGELGIVAVPCEVFTEIGLAIKKESPLKPTFTIELANGYNGYLPTAGQHQLGGYETWRARSSYLETAASTKIQAAVLELLGSVAPKSTQ